MFVATFEVLGGAFVLLGLLTRAAAIPLIVIMCVALITTKLPAFGEESLAAALSKTRLDVSLLLASIFLLIAGGGRFAIDRALHPRFR